MGIKISQLPAIATPALSDVFPVVQSGVTYQESFSQLSSLFATAGANANITSLIGLTGPIQAPTFIGDASGNEMLSFDYIGSAVNYFEMSNNTTTNPPALKSVGSDSNIGMVFLAKAAGSFSFNTQATVSPFTFATGTGFQHLTHFQFVNSAAEQSVTFPDQTGTVFLTTKTNGTEAANAVTASGTAGIITTSSLTTAGAASYAITWTNTFITTTSTILLTIMGGTNTTENITLNATAGSGTSTLTIYNNTAATALNGTILIGYMVIP